MRTSRVEDALFEAAWWRLLGLLFERPTRAWAQEVAMLAREVRDPRLREVARRAQNATEGAYLRLLGPGGAVSPREAGHAAHRDPGWELADLSRYYDAFGYAPRVNEPLDHIAVEFGFVGYLHLKHAAAFAADDDETAAVTAHARETFVADHVAFLGTPVAEGLAAVDEGYLAAAAALAAERIPPAPTMFTPPIDPLEGGCGACVGLADDDGATPS